MNQNNLGIHNPVMVIGLGTSGTEIVVWFLNRIVAEFGNVPPTVSGVVLETDKANLRFNEEITDSINPILLSCSNNESLEERLDSSNENYDANWATWFSPSILKTDAFISGSEAGAGHIPPLARARLLERSTFNQVTIALNRGLDAIQHAENRRVAENLFQSHYNNYEVSVLDQVNVFMVGTMNGGTGSGTWLDVAHILRDNHKNVRLYALFTILDANQVATNERLAGNSYASIKIANFNFRPDSKFKFNYPSGPVSTNRRPFNQYQLFSLTDSRPRRLTDQSGDPEISRLNQRVASEVFMRTFTSLNNRLEADLVNAEADDARYMKGDDTRFIAASGLEGQHIPTSRATIESISIFLDKLQDQKDKYLNEVNDEIGSSSVKFPITFKEVSRTLENKVHKASWLETTETINQSARPSEAGLQKRMDQHTKIYARTSDCYLKELEVELKGMGVADLNDLEKQLDGLGFFDSTKLDPTKLEEVYNREANNHVDQFNELNRGKIGNWFRRGQIKDELSALIKNCKRTIRDYWSQLTYCKLMTLLKERIEEKQRVVDESIDRRSQRILEVKAYIDSSPAMGISFSEPDSETELYQSIVKKLAKQVKKDPEIRKNLITNLDSEVDPPEIAADLITQCRPHFEAIASQILYQADNGNSDNPNDLPVQLELGSTYENSRLGFNPFDYTNDSVSSPPNIRIFFRLEAGIRPSDLEILDQAKRAYDTCREYRIPLALDRRYADQIRREEGASNPQERDRQVNKNRKKQNQEEVQVYHHGKKYSLNSPSERQQLAENPEATKCLRATVDNFESEIRKGTSSTKSSTDLKKNGRKYATA